MGIETESNIYEQPKKKQSKTEKIDKENTQKQEEEVKYSEADLEEAKKELDLWEDLHIYRDDYRRAINKYLEISQSLQQMPVKEKKALKYTLEDLERERQWDSGDGPNNPRAWSRKLREHNRRLSEIEDYLKNQGILKETGQERIGRVMREKFPEIAEQEKLNETLDKLYPDAKSRTIVDYGGEKYQIRYFPISKSRSGKTVRGWGHEWKHIEGN